MSNLSKLLKDLKEETEINNYKLGKPVKGAKRLIPAKNGKEEAGLIIYKRKAEYHFNV